jgi:hypothetical protein
MAVVTMAVAAVVAVKGVIWWPLVMTAVAVDGNGGWKEERKEVTVYQ